MHQFLSFVFLLTFTLSISGCDESTPGDAVVGPTSGAATDSDPATAIFTLGGNSTVANNLITDGDVNDPSAKYFDNNSAKTAQAGPNPGTVLGYLSARGHGPKGSRFENTGDTLDTYRVSLAGGQFVSVQIANWNSDAPGAQDIDLFLYDANQQLQQSSEGITALESITVPASSEYYIVLKAKAGASNYTLRIGSGETTSAGRAGQLSRLHNFEAGAAIVSYKNTKTTARQAKPTVDHTAAERHENRAMLLELENNFGRAKANFDQTYDAWSGEPLTAAEIAKDQTIQQLKRLRAASDVQTAEPNYLLQTLAVPNDPYYIHQWHYPRIHLPEAWDITKGSGDGDTSIVAVLDSGVVPHPDLQGQLVAGYDFIRNAANARDGDGIDSDPFDPGISSALGQSAWHGTHISGTVAGKSDNNLGIAGVAPSARIMPIRVIGSEGSTYDITQGIRFAAGLLNDSGKIPERRADVINLSLGGFNASKEMQDAITAARAAGVVVVAAAGNNASNTPVYPASYRGVIAVSASDFGGALASYSNYGSHIDVCAPGGDFSTDKNADGKPDAIFSTLIKDTGGAALASYGGMQGTSMAVPHVSGVIALMKAVNANLSPQQIDNMLASGALTDDAGAPGRDNFFGEGSINAYKAVLAAQSLLGEAPSGARLQSSSSRFDFGNSGERSTLRLESSGGLISGITVSTDSSWLKIGAAVDNNGGLEYQLRVSRNGLGAGVYNGSVRISSSANGFELPVTLAVSTSKKNGNAGEVYFMLFESGSDKLIQRDSAHSSNGQYKFNFEQVPAGSYYVVAGNDLDNDGYICGSGEACGGWPLLNNLEVVRIGGSQRDLNFVIGTREFFSINSSVSTAAGNARGIRRK